jgi:hypothetical protein
LGHRCDTEKDEISEYVKFDYSEKKKGSYVEDSADLSFPKANLLDCIAMKVL